MRHGVAPVITHTVPYQSGYLQRDRYGYAFSKVYLRGSFQQMLASRILATDTTWDTKSEPATRSARHRVRVLHSTNAGTGITLISSLPAIARVSRCTGRLQHLAAAAFSGTKIELGYLFIGAGIPRFNATRTYFATLQYRKNYT